MSNGTETRQRDIRKSKFVEVTSSETTDYFDLVRSGQNFKITQANLAADFGVSGSLQTRGEITGTPILTVIADVNYIRNVIDGPGIVTSLTAQDGVQFGHNFTVNKTGAPIMINEAASSPTFRSMTAGAGMAIAAAGDELIFSTSVVPVSTKTVQIFEIGDFPTPVSGIITLEDDTEYKVQNDVSSANRYVMGANTVLSGADSTMVTLEYTGTGNMITATDKTIKLKNCTYSCSLGTFLNIASTTGLHGFRMISANVVCDVGGTIDNMQVVYFDFVDFTSITTSGLVFTGTTEAMLMQVFGGFIASGAGDFIDLSTSVFTSLIMQNCYYIMFGTGVAINGLVSSGNIASDGLGTLTRCVLFGTADLLGANISPYDTRWQMFECTGVADSIKNCLVTNTGTIVSIGGAATPVKIGAAWVEQDAKRFTTTTGGTFTYTGRDAHADVSATISADVVSSSYDCTFFVALNGVVITASGVQRLLTSGVAANLNLIWSLDLETNDYIEIWCQNDTNPTNIEIFNATLRID